MNRKQNSLMRFSRTERLAQLSEQEIVIERKKREIQAKIEAQKKKETEEALRKLESTREIKSSKPEFSKVSISGIFGEKNSNQEKSVEQVKESLPNAFSNDGSFLDQFKKLSQLRLPHNDEDIQALSKKQGGLDEIQDSNKKQVCRGFGEKGENSEFRNKKFTSSISDSHSSLAQKSISSKIQLQIPPPGVVHLIPEPAGVKVIASNVNDLKDKYDSGASYLSAQKSQNSGTAEHLVSAMNLKNLPSNSSLFNCSNVLPPVSSGKKEENSAHGLSLSSFSSIQPPHLINCQNTPNLPVQVQNKSYCRPKSELPKNRSETISMVLKPNTIKKLEAIPNPLEADQSPPSSPNQTQFSFTEKSESFKPAFLSAPQNSSFTSSLENASHDRDLSRISSAFCDYDKEEKEGVYQLIDKYHHWADLVSRCGDEFEDSLRSRCENEPELRFLLDKNSAEYLSYRKIVLMYQKRLKSCERDPSEKPRELTSKEKFAESIFRKNDEFSERGNNNKSDRDDKDLSESEKMTSVYEQESKLDFRNSADENVVFYKEISQTSKENYSLFNQSPLPLKGENSQEKSITDSTEETNTEERRKRKRKSRWGEAIPTSSTSGIEEFNQSSKKLCAPKPNLLSQITRSDPGLIQYARQTFGSTNLSEEDWKKAEDHYKINLLYQDMLKKRAEVEKLEKQGKFKYEYDSDEDTEGGTWEHKLRQQEMQATQLWAEELTRQAAGKHHIGDFLPPEELERFMEKYNAVKEGREPDLSDYKEYKLKQDNVGYRLLQKMGWNEGQGLGQDGSGMTNPVNKATTRHENQGLGVERPDGIGPGDDEYDAYRKRMMLAYRFRPNPLNNPRRPYY